MIKKLLLSLVRIALVFLMSVGLILLVGKVVHFATLWPKWAVPLLIALATEAIIWLYRYERQVVDARRGRLLTGLRLFALALLSWILLEPVWSRMVERKIEKEVVILVDDSASMHLIDDGQTQSRQDLALAALKKSGLLDELEGKVAVRELKAARRALAKGEVAAEGWNQATDLVAALDSVLEQIPPDNLGGVVLLTDGRHNGAGSLDDLARRYGILDAPIAVFAEGSEVAPKDAAILAVNSPDAVYLGDRVRVAATLKFDGYKGKKAKVKLLSGDKTLAEEEIAIPQDHHRAEVKFQHLPEKGGVGAYRIVLEPLEGERFDNNNAWDFETAVTDARTNVLLVDSYPRWEFRYLRNLFYGRDKSIHLQYVLSDPDSILAEENPVVAASASRPFGEAQATKLPENEEEWRKFDVIIIGDVNADFLSAEQWEIIDRCVTERGALLAMVAGPRSMPHAYTAPAARKLIPLEFEPTQRTFFGNGSAFHIGLTLAGKNHPVTAQVEGVVRNEQLWNSFPEMNWRHPVGKLREGAQVLLTAKTQQNTQRIQSESGLQDALNDLAKRREEEIKNALLVTRQTGKGKVALLLTDRTWRLRVGVGDTYHHRFWGQLVRWGAGPILRSGTSKVRLSSDQLTYTGDDRVRITARLRDETLAPVQDETLQAEITFDDKVVSTVPLAYIEGSNGLHEALAGPFPKSGQYEIRLKGQKIAALFDEPDQTVTTGFRVIGARSPVELSETTLNLPLLENMAKLSGGMVVKPQTDPETELAALFVDENSKRKELRETSLWDRWYLLVLLLVVLTAEWIFRRGGGLP